MSIITYEVGNVKPAGSIIPPLQAYNAKASVHDLSINALLPLGPALALMLCLESAYFHSSLCKQLS